MSSAFSSSPAVSSSAEQRSSFLQKKMIARKRQAEILKKRQSASSALMDRLLQQEGMETDELESRPAQDGPSYDCPICNGAANTDGHFGLFVYAQTSSGRLVALGRTPGRSVGSSMVHVSGRDAELRPPEQEEEDLLSRRRLLEQQLAREDELLSLCELKACGHHAHFSCFKDYKQTVEVGLKWFDPNFSPLSRTAAWARGTVCPCPARCAGAT